MPHALSQGLPQGHQQVSFADADCTQLKGTAEKLLNDHIIEGSFTKNRWFLHGGAGHRTTKADGDRIKVIFDVRYGLNPFDPTRCDVEFTFQGKNWGGVKQYDLVEAKLENWKGADLDLVKGQFDDVAKELFRNKIGTIDCQRFDENTFANYVVRQAEVSYGARLGEFRLNKVERIGGGIKILLYTDNHLFNPEIPIHMEE